MLAVMCSGCSRVLGTDGQAISENDIKSGFAKPDQIASFPDAPTASVTARAFGWRDQYCPDCQKNWHGVYVDPVFWLRGITQ